MEFQGKNVLITGGTKGIGQHIASAFYNHGAKVIVVGTNSKRINGINSKNNSQFIAIKCDFTKDNYNIVIGAGSSGPDTRWGEKNFISLINKLNAIGNYYFYIQCGPEQNEISKNIINKIEKKNCMDLSKMNISEIIPILSLCDMYVGNDSFSHHITSQCNKPSIVLLLNSPKAYSDYSKNHHRIIPENAKLEELDHSSNYSASSIGIEKVLNKVLELKN